MTRAKGKDWKIVYPRERKKTGFLLTPGQKINSRWMNHLNVKANFENLQENRSEYLFLSLKLGKFMMIQKMCFIKKRSISLAYINMACVRQKRLTKRAKTIYM